MRILLPFIVAALALPASLHAAENVSVPSFRSIEVRGGGDVDVVPGPVQRVTLLSGSTAFTAFRVDRDGKLRIDACNSRCPHNYPLHIRIESPRVPDLAIAGGGTIDVDRGFAPQRQVSAAIMGGGTIDVRALEAADVSAAINGGGDISVRSSASLSAAVNGGGTIHYSGNPRLSMAIHGGGDVVRD
jgi:putative autotransporter adhesin-like protein